MVKRKREEAREEPSVKQRRVQYKLKLGVTKISHAFKVSKGFERQKLGRRQKNANAQGNNKDIERIQSEIVALKALDTTASAQQHFYKSLLKIKHVSDHPNLPSEVKRPTKLPTDNATLNVNARLCKSNQVRQALDPAVDDIQQALGLDVDPRKRPKKGRLRAADFTDNAASTPSDLAHSGAAHRNSHDNSLPFDEGTGNVEPGVLNDGVGSSSDERAFEDDDVEALERRLASEGFNPKTSNPQSNIYNIEADLSISESEFEVGSISPEPKKTSTSKKTSFVPSLTMAGYVAGSGSDTEEDMNTAPRKNRRGQRARQKIWEKKFGSGAKHLHRQERNQGWDPKRGAVDGDGDRNIRRPSQRSGRSHSHDTARGRADISRAGADGQVKKKHRDDGGPIHPSWEAAKNAKEKRDAPVAFQGKKITFD